MGLFKLDSPLMQWLSRLGDWLILHILTILCSVPVLTAGAAVTALYTAAEQVRTQEGTTVRNFFGAFKANFKQSTVLWLLLLVSGALVLFGLNNGPAGKTALTAAFRIIFGLLALLWLMAAAWIFPLQARFQNSVSEVLKNAMLCTLAFFPRTFCMALVLALPILAFCISPEFFLLSVYFWIIPWTSLTALGVARLQRPCMAQLQQKPEEKEE